jgi:hypothetical protein
LDRHRARPKTFADLLYDVEEVGADTVHLVDENDPRNFILVRLPPNGFRLRLDGRDRVEERNQTVEHPQRALDFDREVDVAGGIDNIDARLAPGRRRCRRGDRDAALLLLDHPIHSRGAVVHLAHLMHAPGKEEDAFRASRLAGVDVRGNADVPRAFERIFPYSHGVS